MMRRAIWYCAGVLGVCAAMAMGLFAGDAIPGVIFLIPGIVLFFMWRVPALSMRLWYALGVGFLFDALSIYPFGTYMFSLSILALVVGVVRLFTRTQRIIVQSGVLAALFIGFLVLTPWCARVISLV